MSAHIETINTIGTANFFGGEKKSVLPSNISLPKGFVGREDELGILRKAKSEGKTSFVLHGFGGVGKTDLALKFIDEIKSDYKYRYRVDMFGLNEIPKSGRDARLEIIRNFGHEVSPDISDEDARQIYEALLIEHKPVLLFDNAKDRNHIESLNNASALVFITSRTTFNVTGGFSYEVNQMSPEDARRLLYSVTNDVERFGGLADKLAELAGYVPMALLPLASILADDATLKALDLVGRYQEHKRRLELLDPNRENLSVEASFDLSYAALSDELKACWRKLAVFPKDFDLEAMQTIWSVEDGKAIRAELVGKHLLEFDRKTERSKLHDLAFAYTDNKLTDEERYQTELMHCLYFGNLLATLEEVTLPNLARFDLERTNIEHGFAWLSDKVELDNFFAGICGNYVGYSNYVLSLRLHYRDYIKWLEVGLKASQQLGIKQQIGADLGNLGIAYANLGEYQKAIEYYEQALQISLEIGYRLSERNHLGSLGNAYLGLGEYRKAIEYYEQALQISLEISDLRGEGNCLGNLGSAYFSLGEYQKAIEYHEKSLEIKREIGDRLGEGNSLGNLGTAYNSLGEYRKAIEYHEQTLQISREIGNRQGEGTILGNLGNAYQNLGEYQKAIENHEQALEIAREVGDRQGEGNSLGNLGNAYANLGEYQRAKDFYLQSIAIFEAIGSPYAEIMRRNLARLESKS
jgi:tetratricopeptide (TPR) repeat protein